MHLQARPFSLGLQTLATLGHRCSSRLACSVTCHTGRVTAHPNPAFLRFIVYMSAFRLQRELYWRLLKYHGDATAVGGGVQVMVMADFVVATGTHAPHMSLPLTKITSLAPQNFSVGFVVPLQSCVAHATQCAMKSVRASAG